MQVFFKVRKCTTLPWQAFTLHCSVAAFHDWLLGVSSWTNNPSPISLLENCGKHAIKIMIIIIIIMVMIKISDKINQCYIVIKASSMQMKWIPKKHENQIKWIRKNINFYSFYLILMLFWEFILFAYLMFLSQFSIDWFYHLLFSCNSWQWQTCIAEYTHQLWFELYCFMKSIWAFFTSVN